MSPWLRLNLSKELLCPLNRFFIAKTRCPESQTQANQREKLKYLLADDR
jgi:hypothetical protein